MRKWRCLVTDVDYFTVGGIYHSDNKGYRVIADDGFKFNSTKVWELSGMKFEEITNNKQEKENDMRFKVGDVVEILDGTSGAHGADGRNGIITDKPSNNGLSSYKEGINIDLGYLGIWKVGLNAKLKLITSSPQSFTITVSDTITTIKSDDKTVEIKRYHEDKHDVKVAIDNVVKKYFDEVEEEERLSKLPKVGDKVKVIDSEKTNSTYDEWLIKYNVGLKSAIKWQFDLSPNNGDVYTIKAIHPHEYFNRDLALIEDGRNAFIIGLEGLEVVK